MSNLISFAMSPMGGEAKGCETGRVKAIENLSCSVQTFSAGFLLSANGGAAYPHKAGADARLRRWRTTKILDSMRRYLMTVGSNNRASLYVYGSVCKRVFHISRGVTISVESSPILVVS